MNEQSSTLWPKHIPNCVSCLCNSNVEYLKCLSCNQILCKKCLQIQHSSEILLLKHQFQLLCQRCTLNEAFILCKICQLRLCQNCDDKLHLNIKHPIESIPEEHMLFNISALVTISEDFLKQNFFNVEGGLKRFSKFFDDLLLKNQLYKKQVGCILFGNYKIPCYQRIKDTLKAECSFGLHLSKSNLVPNYASKKEDLFESEKVKAKADAVTLIVKKIEMIKTVIVLEGPKSTLLIYLLNKAEMKDIKLLDPKPNCPNYCNKENIFHDENKDMKGNEEAKFNQNLPENKILKEKDSNNYNENSNKSLIMIENVRKLENLFDLLSPIPEVQEKLAKKIMKDDYNEIFDDLVHDTFKFKYKDKDRKKSYSQQIALKVDQKDNLFCLKNAKTAIKEILEEADDPIPQCILPELLKKKLRFHGTIKELLKIVGHPKLRNLMEKLKDDFDCKDIAGECYIGLKGSLDGFKVGHKNKSQQVINCSDDLTNEKEENKNCLRQNSKFNVKSYCDKSNSKIIIAEPNVSDIDIQFLETIIQNNLDNIQTINPKNEIKMEIVSSLSKIAKNLINHDIEIDFQGYGSQSTDTSFKVSDINITILTNTYIEESAFLEVIQKGLLTENMLIKSRIFNNETTRIPFLLMQKFHPIIGIVDIKLTVNNILGVQSARLLKLYHRLDPRISCLVKLIIIWAKRRLIIDSYNFFFSSYVIHLLVIFYLQRGTNPLT